MLNDQSLENFLKLYSVKGIGYKFLKRFYDTFGTFGGDFYGNLKTLLGRDRFEKLKKELESKDTLKRFELTVKCCKKLNCKIIPFWSEDYPKPIVELSENPPTVLFVLGKPVEGFSIVGTRRATDTGLKKAEEFARAVAERGITIISGGAEGIDRAAHIGALKAEGKTGVILGEGLDVAFKRKGKFLHTVVSKGGFVLSQFPMGFSGTKWSFPKRNETIALLSTAGCFVVEAPSWRIRTSERKRWRKSGALITAEYCRRYGRKVFTYIGFGEHPNYRGCIELLKTGAEFVATGKELLQFLEGEKPQTEKKRNNAPIGKEQKEPFEDPVLKPLSEGAKSFDELLARSGLDPTSLMERLTELQLEGKVREEGGFYYLG